MKLARYVVSILAFSLCAYAGGSKGLPTVGPDFYFDSTTNKYFTNGQPTFSIQPVGNAKYLERIEVSTDNGDFSKYTGKLSFQKEGLHTIRFRAVDPVLNWSPVQVFRLYVDLTPPTSKVSWKGPSYLHGQQLYITPQSKLMISAEDNLSGPKTTYVQIGNGQKQVYSGPITFAHNGLIELRISSVDRVGNQEPWKQISFVVDSQPPVTTAHLQGVHFKSGTTFYVNYGSQIVLSSHDDGAGLDKIEYKINGGATLTYTGPITLDQKHAAIKYRGVDFLGNTEDWKNLDVIQDSQPPTLNVTEVGKYLHVAGKTFAKPGYAIEVQASDPDSGVKTVEYSTNNKDYQPLVGHELKVPENGEFTYNVRAVDQVGNIAEANPITVVIDQTPPATKAVFAQKVVTKGNLILTSLPNKLSLVSEDSGCGVDRVEVSYDNSHFSTLKDAIDLATWRDSLRTVYFRGVDRLGNVEPTQKLTVQVLTRGPMVDLFVESGNLPSVPLSSIIQHQEPVHAGAAKLRRRARRHTASVSPNGE